jgi:hypothetical protein
MGKTATILAAGLVSIGMATALFAPGRQTTSGIKAAGTAGSSLFNAAEGR